MTLRVHAGGARVKDCLEAHREEPGFSAECKEEFEGMMEARAADFRLDSTLREVGGAALCNSYMDTDFISCKIFHFLLQQC